ncbi:hypothetical protein DIPPA_33160 [Diplonema papillatum]|nr:hypothetical protein DIPPA_33160 [Diplonema papillatum]
MQATVFLLLALANLPNEQVNYVGAQHHGHVDGLSIRQIFTAGEGGRLVRHVVGGSPRVRREVEALGIAPFNASQPSKRRTEVCAQLALAMKHLPLTRSPYSDEVLASITAAGDSILGSDSVAQERERTEAFFREFYDEIGDPTGDASVAEVTALVWQDAEQKVTVLVFPGTASFVDSVEALSLAFHYVLSRTQGKMKQNWLSAGLPWGPAQEANEGQDTSFDYETLKEQGIVALAALQRFGSGNLTHVMAVAETMFELTTGRDLVITGLSLGGARAQVASVFLRTKHGARVPTITFASVGGGCVNSRLWNGGYFSPRVLNTSFRHDQITEYVHPLDTYGNGYGIDHGTQCLVGKTDDSPVKMQTVAKWCSPVYGYHGARLMRLDAAFALQQKAAENPALATQLQPIIPLVSGFLRNLTDEEVADIVAHEACRYFTHNPTALYQLVMADLQEDGSTKSGCSELPALPIGSTQCPWNTFVVDDEEGGFWDTTGAPFFIAFICITAVAVAAAVVQCIVCPVKSEGKHRRAKKQVVTENEGTTNAPFPEDA